jgi:hypothetical protein
MEDTTTDATERSDVRHNVYYGNDGVTYLFTSLGTEHVDWPRHRREEMRKKEMREENNMRFEKVKNVNDKQDKKEDKVKEDKKRSRKKESQRKWLKQRKEKRNKLGWEVKEYIKNINYEQINYKAGLLKILHSAVGLTRQDKVNLVHMYTDKYTDKYMDKYTDKKEQNKY